MPAAPVIGFPEKFELALRYGEGRMAQDVALSDSDKLLLDALAKQATVGPCKEPRPSMFDAVAKARWQAWSELGNRSKMEAMFMYTQAVEELAPTWWQWPPLQLGTGSYIPLVMVEGGGAAAAASGAKAAAAEPSVPAPLILAPNGQPSGGWSALPEMGGPARYRHAVAVAGASLFVFGGRSSSGRLASGLQRLDLLTGRWAEAEAGGAPPELRWGHSMDACGKWLVVFGGLRNRACLDDAAALDTEVMVWRALEVEGVRPPARGNHTAAVLSAAGAPRLWVFGGDAPASGFAPPEAWALQLNLGSGGGVCSWSCPQTRGPSPPACCDHAAAACGTSVL
jgi:acyl-CoA-binding protein